MPALTCRWHLQGTWFQHYMIGVNGLCSVYDPPVSYWCSEHPSGGGAFAFRTPSGITPDAGALPNMPYKNPSTALFNVWRPERWSNWMFEVESYDNGTFKFGKGGNQGARGNNKGGDWFVRNPNPLCTSPHTHPCLLSCRVPMHLLCMPVVICNSCAWFLQTSEHHPLAYKCYFHAAQVENVFEELDYPGEFFFDAPNSKLYHWYNGTGAPPPATKVVAPQKQILVNMSGTQWSPVKNITFSNIKYTASSYTYMERHAVPSAGDWALDRFGAIFLQGTEGVTMSNCTFDRLDGNAVMVSGYNRNATITNSDFSFLGGNAVVSWGFTNETDTDPGRPGVAIANAPHAGIDGTDGEHPRYTTVTACTAREIGLYEKQSSFFIMAKSSENTIRGNVFFNGPRAGINANDVCFLAYYFCLRSLGFLCLSRRSCFSAVFRTLLCPLLALTFCFFDAVDCFQGFGGGDDIGYNLVFSTCRESGDHGPFNSCKFLLSICNDLRLITSGGVATLLLAYRLSSHIWNAMMSSQPKRGSTTILDNSAYGQT